MSLTFSITCLDNADSLDLRMTTRPAHLDYVARAETDVFSVLIAGPLLNADEKPMGSHFLVSAENEDAVKEFSKNDPYTRAGLFADITIRRFNIVAGALNPQ